MGTSSYTAADVMDKSAALMNDAAKTVYTYAAQLPYLNMALDELQESFQLNNIPIYNVTSASIIIAVGIKIINIPVDGPADLIEIQGLYERLSGSNDPFVPMVQREFLPHAINDLPTEALQYWAYQGQVVNFIGALTAREIKMDYLKAAITSDVVQSTVIGVIDAKSFLYYKTAALCTQFIGENKSRSDDLNGFAISALDRVTGIGVKGKQSINTRRRPFMMAYKRRSFT